jgi:cytochrome c
MAMMSNMTAPYWRKLLRIVTAHYAGSTDHVALAFRIGNNTSLGCTMTAVFTKRVFLLERVMKRSLLVVAALTALASNAAMANADLAKAKNCLACHAVASKLVGPSFKDIAAKYAGKGADDALVQKVLKGSTGVWGPVPMPANAQVNEADARTLVKWILSQK